MSDFYTAQLIMWCISVHADNNSIYNCTIHNHKRTIGCYEFKDRKALLFDLLSRAAGLTQVGTLHDLFFDFISTPLCLHLFRHSCRAVLISIATGVATSIICELEDIVSSNSTISAVHAHVVVVVIMSCGDRVKQLNLMTFLQVDKRITLNNEKMFQL